MTIGWSRARKLLGEVVDWALIAWGTVSVALLEKAIEGDGAMRFGVLSSLVQEHRVVPHHYSMLGPTFAAPLWWLGEWFGTPQDWVAWFNCLLLLAFVLVARRLLRPEIGDVRARRFVLLCLGASMLATHSRFFLAEMFTAVLVGIGLLLLAQRHWLGPVLATLGAANTPATGPALALVALWITVQERRILAAAALGTLFFALICAENWLERGNFLDSGYLEMTGTKTVLPYSGLPGFSYPFVFGLMSILLSFGRGLVWFTPGAFVPLGDAQGSPTMRRSVLYLSLFVAGIVLTYSKWWSWYGGWFWGPRFFLVASVLAALRLAIVIGEPASRKTGMAHLAVLTLSAWVSIDGVVFAQKGLDQCSLPSDWQLEPFVWYTPEFSALWHPFTDPAVWFASGAEKRYAAFATVAFAWLALPVLRGIVFPAVRPVRADGLRQDASAPSA